MSQKGYSGFKRLFFDIETAPNIVYSWNIGYNINLSYENIIQERSIICICYKWEHEKTVHSLSWDNGNDYQMLKEFAEIMNISDETIGHNGDQYDVKWFRTRCLYHGIQAFPEYSTIDTLKLSRKGFRFNSNKLDYISRYLNIGTKTETGGFDLWKEVMNGNQAALSNMVKYCKNDVLLLEKVFQKLNPYTKHKTHAGIIAGKGNCSCPNCTSSNYTISRKRITSTGIEKIQLQCKDCYKYYTITKRQFESNNKEDDNV